MTLDLRQARSFLAVAEHLNFRRAAEQLGMTQPALSMQISALEGQLGVVLLHRDRQGTALTFPGSVFRDEVAGLLQQALLAAEKARRAAKGSIDFLRIGFISTATTARVLSPLISAFRAAHPHVELTLQNFPNARQMTMIEAKALDVGFFRLPVSPNPAIDLVPIHREEHVVLMSERHPLAQKKAVQVTDLNEHPLVMYSRKNAPAYHDMLMRTLNNVGINPRINQEVGEMYTLVALVCAGIGIAIAPVSTMNYHLPGLIVRHLSWLPPAEIAIAYRKDTVQPACRMFLDMARQWRMAGASADRE